MRKLLAILCSVGAALAVGLWGLDQGWWRPNHPDPREFPEWGVDVSHHQGAVDWPRVASEPHLHFAYLKATEGSDWVDPRFAANWSGAQAAGLRVGAYHFYTFCSDPRVQAQHFLAVVPRDADALPPAVDLELGGNCRTVSSRESLQAGLSVFLAEVERVTHQQTIVYVTQDAYERFVQGGPLDGRIWIRAIWSRPAQAQWELWQFTPRAHVPGIQGFVDLNVSRCSASPRRCH